MILRMNEDPPVISDLSQVFLPPLDSLGPSPHQSGVGLKEEDSNDFPISSHPGLSKELVFDDLCSFQNNYTVPDSQTSGKRKRSLSPVHNIDEESIKIQSNAVISVEERLPPAITLTFDDFSEDSLQDLHHSNIEKAVFRDLVDSDSLKQILPSALSQFKRMKMQMIPHTNAVSQEMITETQPVSYSRVGNSQAIDSQDEDVQKLKAEAASMIIADPLAPDSAFDGVVELLKVEESQEKLEGFLQVEETQSKDSDEVKATQINGNSTVPSTKNDAESEAMHNNLNDIGGTENSQLEIVDAFGMVHQKPEIFQKIDLQSSAKSILSIPVRENIIVSLADESADPLVLPESFFGSFEEVEEFKNPHDLPEEIKKPDAVVLKENIVSHELQHAGSMHQSLVDNADLLKNMKSEGLPILRERDNFNSASAEGSQKLLFESIPPLVDTNSEVNNDAEEVKSSMPIRVDGGLSLNLGTEADKEIKVIQSIKVHQPIQPTLSLDVFMEGSDISLTQDVENVCEIDKVLESKELKSADKDSVDLNAADVVEDSQLNFASQAFYDSFLPLEKMMHGISASNIEVPISTPETSPESAALKHSTIIIPSIPVATIAKDSFDPLLLANNATNSKIKQRASIEKREMPIPSSKPPSPYKPSPPLRPQKSTSKASASSSKLGKARKIDFAQEGRSSSPRRTRQKSLPSYAESDTSSAFENENDEDYEMTQREVVDSPIKVKQESKTKSKKLTTPKSILKNSSKGYSTAQDSSPCMDRTTMVTFKTSVSARAKEKSNIFGNFKFVLTVSKKDGTFEINTATPDLPEKAKLIKMIEALDGKKLDNFSSVFDKRNRKPVKDEASLSVVVLIAYVPVRTHKYLMALALGIPVVSAVWVLDCKRDSVLHPFNRYILDNGHSVLEERSISPRASPRGIFEDKTFLGTFFLILVLASKDSEGLVSDWKDVLISCGASIVTKKKVVSDFVLVLGNLGNKLLGNIESGILVAYPWIIACLIHQTLLDPSLHLSFTDIA